MFRSTPVDADADDKRAVSSSSRFFRPRTHPHASTFSSSSAPITHTYTCTTQWRPVLKTKKKGQLRAFEGGGAERERCRPTARRRRPRARSKVCVSLLMRPVALTRTCARDTGRGRKTHFDHKKGIDSPPNFKTPQGSQTSKRPSCARRSTCSTPIAPAASTPKSSRWVLLVVRVRLSSGMTGRERGGTPPPTP